jgi:diguanylate cyclase (GGDEF)-like protein
MQPFTSGDVLAVPPGAKTAEPLTVTDATPDEATSAMLLATVRRLMRLASSEEVVGAVMDAVRDMGGSVTPIRSANSLNLDLSFGMGGPLLAEADRPDVYALLQEMLPALVDDARLSIERIESSPLTDAAGVTDPLTGLGNWTFTLRVLERMTPGDAVAIIDLENLKQINDYFSPATGDQVLLSFARTLRRVARAADSVGRVGGTEFVWLFRNATAVDAESALRRLRSTWEAERLQEATFAAGVAAVTVTGSSEAYIHAADALENAKRGGSNQTFVNR